MQVVRVLGGSQIRYPSLRKLLTPFLSPWLGCRLLLELRSMHVAQRCYLLAVGLRRQVCTAQVVHW